MSLALQTKIIYGNCLEELKKLPDNSVDLVCTDPPYCIGTTSNGNRGSFLDNNLVLPFFNILLDEIERILKPTGQCYINTDWRTYPFLYFPISKRLTIKNCIVWNYKWIKAGSHYRFTHEFIIFALKNSDTPRTFDAGESDVWEEKPLNFTLQDKRHNAEKPLDLIERIIRNSSKIGDLVVDPFCGTGTTGVASKKLGRNFIGIEIDETHYKTAKERIESTKQVMTLDIQKSNTLEAFSQ